ncbi:MAG: DUF2000 domain-containing protein [Chloroflexota bacterium]|nr:DUF2000 domain-containing protein [Chloroflexota bacterium]
MTFDTKIVVVLRDDLQMWQKLNVTAFLVSGIAATVPGVMGEPYQDGSGNQYLPMFVQPTMVFAASAEQIAAAYNQAMAEGIQLAIFTEDLFKTGNDVDNRAVVLAVPREELRLVGFALRDKKEKCDRVFKGLSLHK